MPSRSSDPASSHLDAHLRVPFTTRDLMGICRGRCVAKGCSGCPGGYLKNTKDYYASPPPVDAAAEGSGGSGSGEPALTEDANSRNRKKIHPDCDVSLTQCSRCGCGSIEHEVDESGDARARGNDAFATGELRHAIAAYSRAVALAPSDAKAFSNRAAAILALGNNPSGALADAQRAVRIEPTWAKARARMGEAYTQLGQHEEAARAWGVAARLDGGYKDAAASAAKRSEKESLRKKKPNPPAQTKQAPAANPVTRSTPPKPPIGARRVHTPNQPPSVSSVSSSSSPQLCTPCVPVPSALPSDTTCSALAACERLTAAVAAAADAARAVELAAFAATAQRDALVCEVRALELEKSQCAKTVAALHTQARLAREVDAKRTLETDTRLKNRIGVDCSTQTEVGAFFSGAESVVEDRQEPVDVARLDANDAHLETRGSDEKQEGTDDLPAKPPGEDKTSETLLFFESFRKAFDADADASDGDGSDSEPETKDSEAALEEWAERWEREQWERRRAPTAAPTVSETKTPDARRKTPGFSSSHFASPSSSSSTRVDTSALTKLLNQSQRPTVGDKDDEGRARGPCRSCVERTDPKSRCYAFASKSGWQKNGADGALAPLARATPDEALTTARQFGCVAVSPHHFARQTAASRIEAGNDGAVCARCGCSAETHASRRDTARMLRRDDSRVDAEAAEETRRLERITESAARNRDAQARGETIRETHLDAVSGAERVGCDRCGPNRCARFTCLFSETDATNPESVLFCSTCGCAAVKHPVCGEWQKQQETHEAAQAAMRARMKAVSEAARCSRARQQRGGADETTNTPLRRRRDLNALGLESVSSVGTLDAHTLARAYKRAALRWHPDKQGGDADKFVEATEAFRRLREAPGSAA